MFLKSKGLELQAKVLCYDRAGELPITEPQSAWEQVDFKEIKSTGWIVSQVLIDAVGALDQRDVDWSGDDNVSI